MKEMGVQMIAAYSPQARGRSERSFGTWQGRLPQELRLAGITTLEAANTFLRERYIREFNAKFTVKAAERGTAFRRCGRADLDWIFTVQTERVVAKDNTVAIAGRSWQLDKSQFRHSLARCTVTIHEHLDATISIRYGPHVIGSFEANGERRLLSLPKQKGRRLAPPKENTKADRSRVNKSGQIDLLTTGKMGATSNFACQVRLRTSRIHRADRGS